MDAASPPLELFRLYPDALSDCHAAAYCLLVVAPVTALASRLLLYRGKSTTPLQVYLLSLATPALAVLAPMYYWPEENNVYKMLSMSRQESLYQWSQKYAFLRKHFQNGQMSPTAWKTIDSAYDNIYNDKSRYLYDFWGPGQEEMTLNETLINVGLFYVLWIAIIYAITTPKAARAGSKLAFVSLMGLMSIELTVRLTRYDPVIKEISPFTTPREYLMWGHRYYPIVAFAAVAIKKAFYVDLEKHHQSVLIHMLHKNMETVEELKALNNELVPKSESANDTQTK